MDRTRGRKRKLVTGWRLFFLTVAALAVFWYLDNRFTRSAPTQGFYPADTYRMISSWDFPQAWAVLQNSDALKRMKDDWPRPYGDLELAARHSTGMRPTPPRWGLWLGARAVFAFAPEGVGLTAYPGHLLRWTDSLRRAIGFGPDDDGIASFRDYSYAWHNGYLVASKSRAYVAAAITSEFSPLLYSDSEALATVQWEGAHSGRINILRGDGLPISGQIQFTATDGDRAMTLPQAWPERAAMSVTARDVNSLTEIWSAIDAALSRSDLYKKISAAGTEVVHAWSLQAPGPEWGAGQDHVSLALFGVEPRADLPLPGVAVAMRYEGVVPEKDPLNSVFAARQTIPFTWNGCSGYTAPLLGTGWSPCVAKAPHEWVVTSKPSIMEDVAGKLADGPACAAEVDVALRASWKECGAIAEAIAVWSGEAEALSRINIDDVRADLVPKIAALSKLGEIAIDGVARGGTLKFSGYLAKPADGGAQ